jgi:hypothetical protein
VPQLLGIAAFAGFSNSAADFLHPLEAGGGKQVTYVSPNQQIADTLRILFDGKSASIAQNISDIHNGENFDAIVCQPALGHRATDSNQADGFGGEVVFQLAPFLAEGGTLYWITARGVLFTPRGKATLSNLQEDGLHTSGVIDLASGAFLGTLIEGAVIAFRREVPVKRFVGALRDLETAGPMASAFLAEPSKKSGPSWIWLDADDQRTFAAVELDRLLQKLTPRGRHTLMDLGSLLASERIKRANRPVEDGGSAASFLFIPEYAGSRVTADLEDQTVKPSAVYRLAVDPAKVNPRFLGPASE